MHTYNSYTLDELASLLDSASLCSSAVNILVPADLVVAIVDRLDECSSRFDEIRALADM